MIRTIKNKITKLDKDVIWNTALVFGYRLFQKTISFSIIFFLVRALTPEQFGEYNFIITLLSFATITALPGIQESITQSTARGFQGTYRLGQKISFISSLIGAVSLLIFALWNFQTEKTEIAIALTLTSILFPFAYGLEQWKGLRKGMEDFKTIVKMGSLFSTIQGILIIIAVLIIPNSYILPLLFLLLIPVIKNLFMTYKANALVDKTAPDEKDSLKYGYKVTGYSIFNITANNIDSVLIFTFLSPAALAIYVVANKMPELVKKFIQDFGAVLAPRFAKHEKYTKETDTRIKLFALASGAVILLFAFTIMPPLMNFIFGEGYSESILYAQIIMGSLAIGNISILQARYISSKLDAKSFRDITIAMSITRIVSSIALVPFFGIWGAVVSTVIYRLSMSVIVQFVMRRRYKN